MRRARAGDRAAFAELYRAFAGPLFTQCLLPRLGDRAAAEDALAETFRSLLEHLEAWQPQGKSLWFWLARVAVNKANDAHRGRARAGRAMSSYEGLLGMALPAPATPREEVERAEAEALLRDRVQEVLGRINPRYRRAIELRLLEDRERQACADAMEVKLGTFDVLLLRAVRAFRGEWESLHRGGEGSKEEEEG